MKCMICGGQTLPGAKLCLPCRAALRRARDDTISELMPLPRRLEGFAYQHAARIAGALPAMTAPAATPRVSAAEASAIAKVVRGLTPTHFRRMAIGMFVAAAGLLAFIAVSQMQRENAQAAVYDAATATAEARPAQARVSPSTLLGAARTESTTASAPPVATDEMPIVVSQPVALPKDRPKAVKPKAAPRPSITVATVTVLEPPAPPVIIAAPALAPSPSAGPAPDRGSSLASSLARCGGDFFARAGCEQRVRLQYCDGRWGQDALCPAGITNDHGQ